MTKKFPLALLAAMACITPMGRAQAGFLIGNLDGNDGTSSTNLTGGRVKAMGFTLAAGSDYLLTDAILDLRIKGDGVVPIIRIWSNGPSNTPATLLATLTDPIIPNGPSIIADISFAPSTPLTLKGGASYWLVASDTANTSPTTYDWMASSPGVTPTGLATSLGSLSGTDGISSLKSSTIVNSYEIDATIIPPVVPEPASMILTGLGLLGSLGYARRRAAAPA